MRRTTRYQFGFICFAFLVSLTWGERKPFAAGLLGGLSGSTFWGKDVKDFDMSVMPTAGVSFTLHLPVLLGLEADALYSYKGGVLRFPGDTIRINEIKAHTIELPIMVKITAATEGEVHPIFFGGPSFARIIAKESFAEYSIQDPNGMVGAIPTEEEIPKENVKDWDYSFVLGGGVEWGLGSLQMRLNLGQRSLDKSGDKEIKTLVIAVLAGFIF